MTLLDKALAALALIGFIAFIGVIGWFVREPDLIIVFVAGGVLAACDFWGSFRRSGNGKR